MPRTARRAAAAVLIAMVFAAGLAGCGSDQPSARVGEAANRLEPMLRDSWSGSFAGLEVDGNRLIIYRKPDAGLDAAVREHASNVEIEFRDAQHSTDDLRPLVDRVNADRPYWRQRGFEVRAVSPRTDGSGVEVLLSANDLDQGRDTFRQRYPGVPLILVAAHGVVPAAHS